MTSYTQNESTPMLGASHMRDYYGMCTLHYYFTDVHVSPQRSMAAAWTTLRSLHFSTSRLATSLLHTSRSVDWIRCETRVWSTLSVWRRRVSLRKSKRE